MGQSIVVVDAFANQPFTGKNISESKGAFPVCRRELAAPSHRFRTATSVTAYGTRAKVDGEMEPFFVRDVELSVVDGEYQEAASCSSASARG